MQVQCLARLELYRAQRQKRHSIPFLLEDKTGLDGIYLPLQFADWPLFEVALLLIGLIQISYESVKFSGKIKWVGCYHAP
jgi:hypothetical protein